MHLNIERRFVIYLLLTMLAFMLLLFGRGCPDVMRHDGRNWENIAAKEDRRALAAGGGGEHGTKAAAQPATLQAPARLKTVHKGVCVPCHGEKGDGNGAAAVALNPKPANFTDPAFCGRVTRRTSRRSSARGGPAVGKSPPMAPFASL